MENYSYNSTCPESGQSSPRSREIEFENPPPWDDPSQSQGNQNQPPPTFKVKFMCSYGGKIHPRPHDNQLSYIGGETKILAADRNIKFSALLSKLMALCDSEAISFKYQLPGEDLDALISVTNDDDLEHMMHEYDRLCKLSQKPARLRIFIFPSQNPALNFGSEEVKTEKDRFVEALNSAPQQSPSAAAAASPASNVDFLFGLEKANAMAAAVPPSHMPSVGRVQEIEDPVVLQGIEEKLIGSDSIQKHIHDLQRLRIEEQQGLYRRQGDDNLPAGEYYKVPEKMSQAPFPGVPAYWTEKQSPGGVFQASNMPNEQQVYMIPAPASGFHTPLVRTMAGAPSQGYYIQRVPPEAYRDHHHQQQQHLYSMIPHSSAAPPQQKSAAAVYSEALGMSQSPTAGIVGVVTEAGYTPVAYDGATGRQVIYAAAPGAMIGAPVAGQPAPAHYQAVAVNAEGGGGKGGAAKAITQAPV